MVTARLDKEDEGRQRSRWTVAWGAGVLLWCAWWYCRGESLGLLWVSAGLAALAVALPRSLPNTQRSVDMSLSRALPKGFGERMRTVLLIQAKEPPGYLRESVYTVYREGTWLRPKPGSALQPAGDTATAQSKRNVYPLVPDTVVASGTGTNEWVTRTPNAERRTANAEVMGTDARTTGVWQVEVHAPQLLSGICVPGNAVMLMGSGFSPLSDTNGMVTVADEMPDRYEVGVTACRWNDSAYPGPDGAADPAYLAVPPVLSGAVSNWVEGCAGLARTPSVREAVKRVEDYFATNFAYRLDVQMKAKPDPLVDFMARREGFCIHFASAAALMFRVSGIPARVIGGFACGEWNSWLGRWVVREREGHAWAEVWDAAEGRWLLVEATPPGSRPEDLAKPEKMRLVIDLLSSGWKRVVFWLKNVNVLAFIAEAGAALFFFLWRVVWSPAGIVLLAGGVGVFWWRWRRLRGKPAKEERLRAELTQAVRGLVRRTVPERLRRRENESWDLWLKRVEPALTEEAFTELRAWIEGYQHLRYRTRLDASDANDWLERVRRAGRTTVTHRNQVTE